MFVHNINLVLQPLTFRLLIGAELCLCTSCMSSCSGKYQKRLLKGVFNSLLLRFNRLVFKEIDLIGTYRTTLFHYDRCIFYMELRPLYI